MVKKRIQNSYIVTSAGLPDIIELLGLESVVIILSTLDPGYEIQNQEEPPCDRNKYS